MSLLFDENLSPNLPSMLGDVFPGSYHLQHFNYSSMPDAEVWRLAAEQGLCIVSCDADFYSLAFTKGPPPKVVWLRLSAAKTDAVTAVLRANREVVNEFLEHESDAVLVLGE